jgi:hypothetical protein
VIWPVPPSPTATEIADAVHVLVDPLLDFRFVSQADLAHAVALELLLFLRPNITGPVPAHLIDKPLRGSGGGLLTNALLWSGLGGPPSKMTEAGDEAEWRRLIFAQLLRGSPVIVVDNIRNRLSSGALASALTEAIVSDRVIRSSYVEDAEGGRIWVLNGNNVETSDEIARRIVPIRIDPGVERPEHRTEFRYPHLLQYVSAQRSQRVHAALTLCQAWHAAGRPLSTKTLGSFESWAQVMGGVLDVARIAGFLDLSQSVTKQLDAAEEAFRGLLDLQWNQVGTNEFGATDLWNTLQAQQDILIALNLSHNAHSQKTQLGTISSPCSPRSPRLVLSPMSGRMTTSTG